MSRLDQIQKMLLAEPQDVFLNFSLGMEYARAGRNEEAVEQFSRVVALDPNYVAAHFQRANALIAMGRTEQAKAALSEGIAAAERVGDKHAASEMGNALTLLGY